MKKKSLFGIFICLVLLFGGVFFIALNPSLINYDENLVNEEVTNAKNVDVTTSINAYGYCQSESGYVYRRMGGDITIEHKLSQADGGGILDPQSKKTTIGKSAISTASKTTTHNNALLHRGRICNISINNVVAGLSSPRFYWGSTQDTSFLYDTGRGNYNNDVTFSITLYWNVFLTLNFNGGTSFNGSNGSTIYNTYNGKIYWSNGNEMTIVPPVRTGYTFQGYYTEASSGSQWFTSSGAINTQKLNKDYVKPTTLYAHWTANTYTVTLDAQNGSGENDGTTKVTATYNSAMPSITIPSKKGYTFQGYYTSKNGGGTKYYNTNGTSARTWNKTSNTTLYAYWTANGYRLTAYANEGKFNSFTGWNKTNDTTIYKTVLFDSALGTLPTSLVSRDGYTFSRWTNSSSGGTEITSSSIMNNTNGIKIYAQWTPKTYTITLNSDGGSGGTQSVQVVFDSNIPSITVPSKIGYVFQGYYTSKNGGGTQYINADGTSTRTWNIPSNTTLYAKWDKATYRIDVNILNPAGVQDYVSGTMCQTYKGSSKVAADQAFSNIKFQESFTISQITPIDGLILSSVTATDGRLVDNQNGTYTFTADFNRQPKGGSSWDASVNIKLGYTWVNYAIAPTEMQNIKRDDGVYVQAKVISKPEHLAWLAKESFSKVLEGYYIQTNSIDMSKYYWYPIKNFRGVYLGQSYPISNLKTSQYTISQSGLFGTMETGSVCDGVVVIGTQIYGAQYTGGIAAINNGTIKNSFVQGNITATDRGVTENNTVVKYHVGGIAGKSSSGVIQNSIFEGSVVKSSTNTKDRYLGLISGYGGTIKDCLASSTISTAFTNSATTINSCIYRINNTKKYYNGTFENWVIVGGNPYPSGITWIGNGGIKVTSVKQIENEGYSLNN